MKTPNILLIYSDQHRFDAMGCAGHAEVCTPNLDRLASQGVRFDHHYVQNPLSMPSRVSMLSGQYPSRLQITHMGVPVPQSTMTLPRMLRNLGYYSANIGKLHFLPHANRDHRCVHPDYGFDHLEISDEPGPYDDAYRAYIRQRMPDQLDRISLGVDPPAAVQWRQIMGVEDGIVHPTDWAPYTPQPFAGRSDATHSAFVAQRTIEWLQGRKSEGRPFFCIAGFYNPHSPLVTPQEFLDMYQPQRLALPQFPLELNDKRIAAGMTDDVLRLARQGYYAMVSEMDHHVGRVLAALDELGLAENTIVAYTSDHGEFLGEQLQWGKGYPGPDCVARTPLIVRDPRGGRAGSVCDGIVEAVDLAPSLLELAGATRPPHLQGESWAAALHGEPFGGKEMALMEFTGWKSIRTAGHRYLLRSDGLELLHDLSQPLGEYRNVAGDPAYAQVLSQHRQRMARRMMEIERPLPRIWPY